MELIADYCTVQSDEEEVQDCEWVSREAKPHLAVRHL